MMFWDNFYTLCTKNGTSPNAVAKKLDVSSGSVTAWKNGTNPRPAVLKKIAEYFNISVEELISGQKEKATTVSGDDLSEAKQAMINWVINAPDSEIEALYNFLQRNATQAGDSQ